MFTLDKILSRYDVARSDAAACAQTVKARYDANQLPYHNWHHVLQVRDTAADLQTELSGDIATQDALFLAIWFHDVIYDPQAGDNEEQSAHWAGEMLANFTGLVPLLPRIKGLILDTKTHQPQSTAGKIIVDADLAILGSDSTVYQNYARAIRQEYDWVAEEAYRHGRANVLQRFLQRPTIYHTKTGRSRWEAQARHNLQQEISRLTD